MLKQLFFILSGAAAGSIATYYYSPSFGMNKCTNKAFDLRTAQRKLWAEHVLWTRNYIIAALAGTPDADAAAKRLMKNQEDLGLALIPLYGKEAGAKLTELLKDHITIAVAIVTAAKANDTDKLDASNDSWHKNADQLASFLARANPHWPQDMMRKMLDQHLALTTHEVTLRLQEKWDDDIRTFDDVFNQALAMADDLAAGIVKQFPDRF